MPYSVKILLIVFLSIFWVLLVPGYVAYKDHVFTGSDFKNRVSDSVIQSRLTYIGNAEEFYKNGKELSFADKKIIKVTFLGFIEDPLGYIWIVSYTFLAVFVFVFYSGWLKKTKWIHFLLIIIALMLLFDGPNWFRNSELGKQGKALYSYVNYEIDPFSYWLQEMRAFVFSFLFGAMLVIGEQIKTEDLSLIKKLDHQPSLQEIVDFSITFREIFSKWQRNMAMIIVVFLPWTLFYWQNITFYEDSRYLFAAILFHSFWILSICLFSAPIIALRKHCRRRKHPCSLSVGYRKAGHQRDGPLTYC